MHKTEYLCSRKCNKPKSIIKMKKVNIRTWMIAAAFAVISGIGFTSCSDDDGPSYSTVPVQSSELKAILTQKGYQFNEQGNLLLDDMATATTSLDLSGTDISQDALSELGILPNLTDVNLSDNGYTMSFDFSKLPSHITGVDLRGNELYEFPGLLNIVTKENGDEDVTVLHPLTKLYLPNSAKYNCDELPTFFAQKVCQDMQMANANGALETYNTLREIPDETFRSILKETFGSLFTNDYIDISKRLVSSSEKNKAIQIRQSDMPNIRTVEGFQYIAHNKGWEGNDIELGTLDTTTIPYLKVNSYVYKLGFQNIDTPNGINLTKAERLCIFVMSHNSSIQEIDLSASSLLGQRQDEVEFASMDTPSYISIDCCDNLNSIVFPKNAKSIYELQLTGLPQMESINLSQFEAMGTLALGAIPNAKLTYFNPLRYPMPNGKMSFAIDEQVYLRQETKDFLDKYHDNLKRASLWTDADTKTYRWDKNYK